MAPNMLNEGEQRPQGDRPKDYRVCVWGGGDGVREELATHPAVTSPMASLPRSPGSTIHPSRPPSCFGQPLATDHTFFG